MLFRVAWRLLRTTVVEWYDDDPFHLAAALAYYTLFSLAPLLLILISLAGFFLGGDVVRAEIVSRARDWVGADAAGVIRDAVRNARFDPSGPFAASMSVILLLLGSTAVFSELQVTLNRIWDIGTPSGGALFRMLTQRLWAIVMIVVLVFLLLLSLSLDTAVSAAATALTEWISIPPFVVMSANFAIAFAVTTVLFAIIYRVFPETEVHWRHALFGAVLTAALFAIGKLLLGLYLGKTGFASTYGAAGSAVLLLAWVYYSSLIFFFGAEFTFVTAKPELWRDDPRGSPDQSVPRSRRARERNYRTQPRNPLPPVARRALR
jgi:membrane protein